MAATKVNLEEIERLKAAEAVYRSLFENALEGIYQSTPDGRYLMVNTALARMYGYQRPEEMLNQVSDITNQIYVDATFRERFKHEIELHGFVRELEYQVRRCDGSVIWISESARAVRHPSGRTLYYEGFIDNITARKEAEAERTQLEKQMLRAQKMDAIGTLASGMAHDFNNILCAILGHTQLALFDGNIKGKSRDSLISVLKSAERAKDLVKRILTISRPAETKRHPLKLGPILSEAAKLLNATLPSSIQINVTIRTADDVVVADATELHQVIMNLGTNAGHAMREQGGTLDYELDRCDFSEEQGRKLAVPAGSYVRLAVRDTGHGMTGEVLERIFEPFFSTKPTGRGTGLGLTLVQKIVTGSGGLVRVESQKDVGTTFTVYLPRSPLAAAAISPEDNQVLPGQREQILVVDDEIPVLSVIQQSLRKMGYRVITRADSHDALETFRAEPNKFDLVITDHTMPGLQGAELAEKVGEIRSEVPVILVTGLNQPPSFKGSRYAPRRAVCLKPINFVELSHQLRDFLGAGNGKS
ncbi:MAG: ATP-binding protein [Verrucomicrobiota bacterium]